MRGQRVEESEDALCLVARSWAVQRAGDKRISQTEVSKGVSESKEAAPEKQPALLYFSPLAIYFKAVGVRWQR